MFPAIATGQYVIDSHIAGLFTAVLADVVIASEDFIARHLSSLKRTLNHVDKPDYIGAFEKIGNGVDVLPAVLYRLRLAFADELHRPANIADVQWLVILIEHQYWRPSAVAHFFGVTGLWSS